MNGTVYWSFSLSMFLKDTFTKILTRTKAFSKFVIQPAVYSKTFLFKKRLKRAVFSFN
jgi:hypothetical protein